MKLLIKLIFIFALAVGFTANGNRISSANFSKSEILTESELLEVAKILSGDKIARLDSLLNEFETRYRFNGNILVALEGYNVFERSVGYSDPIRKERATPQTIYQLASVSKQFTATAIMLLKADGRLSFDDPAVTYIPELPYKDVTIKHLLNHMGGLPNYMYLTDKYWTKSIPPDNEDAIALMATYKLPAYFKPGARYDYSNTGYMVLATIVERISGMSLNDFLQRRVFTPLHMFSTYIYSTADSSVSRRQADGFRAYRSGYSRIADTRNNGPVGDKGVCSTTGDMFKWDRALYNGAIIKPAILHEAFTPATTNGGKSVPYGYGFRMRDYDGSTVIYHNGLWEGARTNFHRYLNSQNTIIVLNNTSTHINHELVRQIENIIGNGNKTNVTEMIARTAMEDGVDAALDLYADLLHADPLLHIDLARIAEVAEYLKKAGKIQKATHLDKLNIIVKELTAA